MNDGFQLWSEEYNSELKDIFAVQDQIARAVTQALQIKLLGANATSALAGPKVTNPEAYQAYLQAAYFVNRGSEKANYDKALAYADQAIKLDANFSPAWALRSDAYLPAWLLTASWTSSRRISPGARRCRAGHRSGSAFGRRDTLRWRMYV